MRKGLDRVVRMGRDLGIPGVRMLGRYRYASARPGLAPHVHRGSLEICLLARGRQTYRVGGRVHRLKGGDQFVTFPGESHDTAEEPQEKGVLYWLILDVSRRGRGLLCLAPEATGALVAALGRLPARHFRAAPGSAEILERVFAILEERRSPPALRRLRAAQGIVDYLLKTVHAARSGAIPEISAPIQAALDFLAPRVGEWIPVPVLAERSGLSTPRFKARFREETGVPPGEFMLRRKVEEARFRLASPGTSVTRVAYDLGFSSSQYFATVFKRYTRRNPSEFLSA